MHIIKRAAIFLAAAALLTLILLLIVNSFPVSVLSGGEAGDLTMKRDDPVRDPAGLRELKEKLEREIRASSMEVSLGLYDFATGSELEINGHKPLYPASMIKTLLLLTALELVERGKFSLQEIHHLSDEDRYAGNTSVTGSGVLQYAENGSLYTIEELLHLMVSVSDNMATNIMFDRVGIGAMEQMARKLGLTQTAFTRKMYELDSPLPSNVSTAGDLTAMLVALEKREAVGKELSELGIRMMMETTDKERIGRYLGDDDVVVANKVGTVTGIIGDMSLLYFPDRPPVALTAAVKNPQEQEDAIRLIGRLAKLVVEHFA
jgi:beta-lactamase class A